MQAELPSVVLGTLLAIATASDLAARRVPNVLVAMLAGTGLLAQSAGGPWSMLTAAAAGIGILAVFSVAWLTGKLGGGDLKLLAAVAIWIGPRHLAPFLLFTALAGLPVALATHALHTAVVWRCARAARSGHQAQLPPRETVPVAVAIALGTAATFHWGLP